MTISAHAPSSLDVFEVMASDIAHVNDRIDAVASIEYPLAATVLSDIVSGGKRLRPLILLLAGQLFSQHDQAQQDQAENLITAAAGVELLHIASLVHDDTVDRAAIRRGKPTLNTVLSTGGVIMVGDYLFAQSAILAAATQSPRVVAVFASSLGEICDGQLNEMFHGHELDQPQTMYERRIHGKTAALFGGAAEMGAILTDAPEAGIEAVRAYGDAFGMAFQIVDDLLDLLQGDEAIGKPAGNDLRQGTITLPIMYYAADLPPDSDQRRRLEALAGGDEPDTDVVNEVLDDIRRSSAIERSYQVVDAFIEKAVAALNDLPDDQTRQLLITLARSQRDRQR